MTKRLIHCAWCNKPAYIGAGHINRQRAMGYFLYCGRECAGLGRRNGKTQAEKRAEKAAYDREYRAKNLSAIKAKKHAHFKANYDPEKARVDRAENMARHVAYCRRHEYKAKKHVYDKRRYASEFGPFAETYMVLSDLQKEIDSRASDYEIRQANGTLNKKQQRRREGV